MLLKKLVLVLSAVLLIFQVQAQSIGVGIKGGGNLASLRNTGTNNDISYKLKFHGGLMFNFGLSNLVSVQPEVVYSQKGFEYKTSGVSAEGKANYIDVPLLLKINAGSLFFEGGPQVSFLAASKIKNGTTETDTKNWTKSTAFGIAAGIGFQSASGLSLGLRYQTDLSQSFVRVLNQPSEARNLVFQLSLGYFVQ